MKALLCEKNVKSLIFILYDGRARDRRAPRADIFGTFGREIRAYDGGEANRLYNYYNTHC